MSSRVEKWGEEYLAHLYSKAKKTPLDTSVLGPLRYAADAYVHGMLQLLEEAKKNMKLVDIGAPDEVFQVEVVMLKDLEKLFEEEK